MISYKYYYWTSGEDSSLYKLTVNGDTVKNIEYISMRPVGGESSMRIGSLDPFTECTEDYRELAYWNRISQMREITENLWYHQLLIAYGFVV